MKKTAYTALEAIASKLEDEVVFSFLKELESLPDEKESYDYDSYMLAFAPFEDVQERLSQSFVTGLGEEKGWTLDLDQSSKIQFMYKEFDFVNAQVEELISKYEGSICCHDKSSTLIRMYIGYIAKNELPDITKGEKEFWKPKHGTAEEWMNFIDSTLMLHMGRPKNYLKAHGQLVSVYEAIVEAKRLHNEQVITASPYFVAKRQHNEKMEYDFEGEKGMTGTVILNAQQHGTYLYKEPGMEGLSRKERYHFERQPWFVELLKQLH
jgi:hypothetical protein